MEVIPEKVFMICVGENIRTKSCLKTFRASLGKFGQKSFVPPKIRLLLHLCLQLFYCSLTYCCFGFRHPCKLWQNVCCGSVLSTWSWCESET